MSTMETDSPPHGALGCLPGNSIAVLAPHPDDEVFGCGGTLRALALRGADIHVAIVCDCPTFGKTDSSDLAAVRREESMAAAEKLGYPSPEFWGFADGKLAGDLPALQARIRAWLKKLDPDLVLAPSVWEVHNDHLAVIEATLRAMADDGSGAQLAMYEVGATLTPDTLVDITEHMGEKQLAMSCFRSQLAMQDYDRHISGLNAYRSYTLGKSVMAAEAFWLGNGKRTGDLLSEFCQESNSSLFRCKMRLAAMRDQTRWRT